MTVHIIKLSVGPESLADFTGWQKRRLAAMKSAGQKPELIHVTRQMPKRAEDVLDGGSIYWVIGGWIVARQKILELRAMTKNDVPHCGLVYDKKVTIVRSRQRRPFQGWRYLDPADAPPDLAKGESSDADMPEEMRRELAKLGLI